MIRMPLNSGGPNEPWAVPQLLGLILVQATKERLLQCITLAGLPDRTQRAARFILLRLDKKPKDAGRSPLQCCAPLPPKLEPAFYDIFAPSTPAGRR